MAKPTVLPLSILVLLVLPGCVDVGSDAPERPLLSTFISAVYIDQDPPSYNDPGVEGYISVCANSTNPNNVNVYETSWVEFYVADMGGNLVLVETLGRDASGELEPGRNLLTLASFHRVRAEETARNGSTRYALHFVSELLADDDLRASFAPPLASNKWVNVTFTPFGRGELYREGQAGCAEAYG